MTKNRMAILAFIVLLAALISYAIGNAVLGERTSKAVSVETARPISQEIVKPEIKVFAADAINPTVQITISDNNQNPIGN